MERKSFAGFCGDWEGKESWNEVAVSIDYIDTIITAEGWRLTQYDPGQGQLFNLIEDPDEQRNLHDDPAFLAKKAELLERLVRLRALPRQVPQYRNFAAQNGCKYNTGSWSYVPYPLYNIEPSPWTINCPRPEWAGKEQV